MKRTTIFQTSLLYGSIAFIATAAFSTLAIARHYAHSNYNQSYLLRLTRLFPYQVPNSLKNKQRSSIIKHDWVLQEKLLTAYRKDWDDANPNIKKFDIAFRRAMHYYLVTTLPKAPMYETDLDKVD